VPAVSRFAPVLGGYQKQEYTQMVLKVLSLKTKEPIKKKFSLR
jgi:hypothetical protein